MPARRRGAERLSTERFNLIIFKGTARRTSPWHRRILPSVDGLGSRSRWVPRLLNSHVDPGQQ
jgi:hypothetical protein